jgi:hypothetical protein
MVRFFWLAKKEVIVAKYIAALFLVQSALLIPLGGPTVVGAELLDRDSLVSDVRQLADMIESIHPDPYTNVGGKVAFHRRFQSVLQAIPPTRPTLLRLKSTFSGTTILDCEECDNNHLRGGRF